MQPAENRRAYWRSNLRITGFLMAIWFVVSFVTTYFAREFDVDFFGWPLSVWIAGQGSLVVYLVIIGYYARTMDRLDREHDLAEED
jgi:putative solute:sodium symporter small subunit